MNQKMERPKILFPIVERGKGKDLIKLYSSANVKFHYQTIGHGTTTSEIMDAVNEQYGIRTEAQAIVCSMKVDHFAPI